MSLDTQDSFIRHGESLQVSSDQASQGKSEIAFSNGASFSAQAFESYAAHSRHCMDSNIAQSNRNGFLSHSTEHNSARPTYLHRPTRPPKHPQYSDYSQRLRSYARWIRRRPDPICLAESGFFFTNQDDLVRCYQCGIGLKNFSESDDPLLEHVRQSENCPFLLENLGAEQLAAMKTRCMMQQQMQSTCTQGQSESTSQCRHPAYQTVAARISSFTEWPRHMIQTPEVLAEAGLFYTGVEDHVRCFTCDGGLRGWDPEDVPWTEHCRWFPTCHFAMEKKGGDFIALVQASAQYNNRENENHANGQGSQGHSLASTMEQMTLRDPTLSAALNEHINTCLEMGFQLTDINAAVQDLRCRGNIKPTIEDILDAINMLKDKQQRAIELETIRNETPLEENLRLKNLIICMACGRNNVNALFLPCTHHRLCMECAEPLTHCPVCDKNIRQKIKTYLA